MAAERAVAPDPGKRVVTERTRERGGTAGTPAGHVGDVAGATCTACAAISGPCPACAGAARGASGAVRLSASPAAVPGRALPQAASAGTPSGYLEQRLSPGPAADREAAHSGAARGGSLPHQAALERLFGEPLGGVSVALGMPAPGGRPAARAATRESRVEIAGRAPAPVADGP